MSGYVLFQIWESHRKSLIAGHLFYVKEARKRLLSQFEDIESEADKAAKDWLERSSSRFDPERHDPADFYEAATEAGIEFYGLLSDMRNQIGLSVVAGMFHEWDKQLRGWIVSEIHHWHRGGDVPLTIWKATYDKIFEFLECIGWKVRDGEYFRMLDACRVVVNFYKHGKGNSLEELKEKYPEYLPVPLNGSGCKFFGKDYRDHTDLKVSGEQIQAFSDAIVAFWQAVPENISDAEDSFMPTWLERAFLKDRAAHQKSTK